MCAHFLHKLWTQYFSFTGPVFYVCGADKLPARFFSFNNKRFKMCSCSINSRSQTRGTRTDNNEFALGSHEFLVLILWSDDKSYDLMFFRERTSVLILQLQ